MKDRLQNFALSLCLLLFLLSGCSQISNTEPVPGSHSDMPAPAIYSESVAGPSQEVWSEQPTAQPDPIDPIATPAADSKADGTAMPKVPIGSDDYTSKGQRGWDTCLCRQRICGPQRQPALFPTA